MEYWEYLKESYFFNAGSITFAVAPFLWIGILFVARIKQPQIIKTVLFMLMYGHLAFFEIGSLIIPPEKKFTIALFEMILSFLSLAAPVLLIILFAWCIGEFVWIIHRKVKSEKAQNLKADFIARTVLQIVLLAIIMFGWWEFVKGWA